MIIMKKGYEGLTDEQIEIIYSIFENNIYTLKYVDVFKYLYVRKVKV